MAREEGEEGGLDEYLLVVFLESGNEGKTLLVLCVSNKYKLGSFLNDRDRNLKTYILNH